MSTERKGVRWNGRPSDFIDELPGSEVEVKRHLNLARGADGVSDQAQAVGAGVQRARIARRIAVGRSGGVGGAIGRRLHWLTGSRERAVRSVLRNLVCGDVEARRVGQVVDVEGVFQVEALLVEAQCLYQ